MKHGVAAARALQAETHGAARRGCADLAGRAVAVGHATNGTVGRHEAVRELDVVGNVRVARRRAVTRDAEKRARAARNGQRGDTREQKEESLRDHHGRLQERPTHPPANDRNDSTGTVPNRHSGGTLRNPAMTALEYRDPHDDPARVATSLGISREAVDLYLSSDVIDLHVDSFIWWRIFRYDLTKRHGEGLFAASFYSQVDFPRVRESAMTGAIWVITTNPLRTEEERPNVFVRNLADLRAQIARVPDEFEVVRTAAEYRAARAKKKHGAFIGIQGGNALDRDLDALDLIPDQLVLRITLVHLSTSKIGVTSSPLSGGADEGLSDFGRAYVRRLNEKKIFVDLAHINRKGFFDAVEMHDKSQPLIVTHTGVSGVHKHWRNLDDEQLRAIADTGGTVGVMFQSSFLGDPVWGGRAESVVRHLEHIVNTVGEDHASLGSDFDGAITPPRDLRTCLELPRLVQIMLDRGWNEGRVRKLLGGNALRAVEALRG